MKRTFVIWGVAAASLSCLMLCMPASAKIYQWKDSSGNIVYGDNPPADVKAEEKKYREDRIIRYDNYGSTTDTAPKKGAGGRPFSTTPPEPNLREYRNIEVVMYVTSWCGYCKKAREYISSLGVRLIEYDIEKNKSKSDEMLAKAGSKGVPVIDVEGVIIKGYNPAGIKEAVERKRRG